MQTRIISLVPALCLAFSLAIPVGAATIVESKPFPNFPNTMTGYIYDEEGNVSEITGHLVESMNPASVASREEISATYAYDVIDYDTTASRIDGGISAKVYLTCYYNTADTPTTYLLTKVAWRWVDLAPDDTTHIKSNATLVYVCTGMGPSGFANQSSGKLSVTNNSYKNTGFTKRVSDASGTMGAQLTITLSQGITRHWTCVLPNWPVDSLAGSFA